MHLNFKWNQVAGMRFTLDIGVHNQVVYWKKNRFSLTSGNSGKQYIGEQTRLLNIWTFDSLLTFVALKAIHVMPAHLVQKPNKKSKSKDHMKEF